MHLANKHTHRFPPPPTESLLNNAVPTRVQLVLPRLSMMSQLMSAYIQPSFPYFTRQPRLASAQLSRRGFERSRRAARLSPHLVPQCSAGKKRLRNRKNQRDSSRDDTILPDFGPLGPTPIELSGFEGWREEDDEYWRDVRERILLYQATTTIKPEHLEPPSHPLDRHGNPTTYPAQAKYDPDTKTWVPTTEEEEERLKNPNPIRDPFFVPEAADDELFTSLRESMKSRAPDWRPIEDPDPAMFGMEDASFLRRRRLQWDQHDWKVVHLGTSSAVPTRKRNVSSTAFLVNGTEPVMCLVDAGENTSRRLLQCDWCMTHGFRWIRAIFITHLHGDHIFGLPNLLSSIGRFAQYRRRAALENGDDGADPVIRIYGPYGIRGFVRSSLYWTNPVGVRFSVSELVPRDTDFLHIRGRNDFKTDMFIQDGESDEFISVPPLDEHECPPPHPEEVRADDIHVGKDGLWHVWERKDSDFHLEVVAAPLKHRLPCFGYVFREPSAAGPDGDGEQHPEQHLHSGNGTATNGTSTPSVIEIDMEKARALGVYGSQFRVLRAGRAVTASKSGLVVRPEDVAVKSLSNEASCAEEHPSVEKTPYCRKVTILGDTCDSELISEAARGSDLLVHEATFTDFMKQKAKVAMHSTARMAGQFGKSINAKKVALTHFSSRHEVQLMDGKSEEDEDDSEEDDDSDEDFASPSQLVSEALKGYGGGDARIVAAYDFMEHEIPAVDGGNVGGQKSEITVQSTRTHS